MNNNSIYQQAIQQLATAQDMWRFAISRFNQAQLYYGHGTTNSTDEALNLLLYSLHLPYSIDEKLLQANLTEFERKAFVELVQKRIDQRIPAAYLTKRANFAGLEFYVDERVLIPRSPIAELIEQQFEPWLVPDKVNKILDLCTGSACIAIACSYAFPEARVDAVDIDADALAVASLNVEKHQLKNQVKLIQSNLLQQIDQKYDLIVSNPPYVGAEEMQQLPKEYQHEPEVGLFAQNNGLAIVETILRSAAKHLNENGILIIEVGNSAEALASAYPQVPFFWFEFERGGDGVFMLSHEQLEQFF